MEEILQEVFIKELHESGIDQVFIVKNLPSKFIYRRVPKMVQRVDRDGYVDGTVVVDKSGEMVDALLEGLDHSQNGDGSIVFPMGFEHVRNALKAIDAYISGTLPRDVVIPRRVAYPQDPSNSRSMPLFRSQIPVVELPVSRAVPSQVSPVAQAAPEKPARTLTEAQKQAARERLALARARKKALNKAPQA